ncbi:effector binding domain-containing protein [Rhodococcus sp. H36-A4]|uniref:effector binding domain-containing protein n=1 Tax=Rhodococcus sp. H36-A4 TaxID=3004353 RepID=UPI0022B0305A|nr:effector binding domain-containing protein [Rhodococcus sp. H36-A4]MCZ4076476.1 effector binding domain-containing protein [Rhodococcus sp. H36-A4]
MTFSVTARSAELFGGLVAPLSVPSSESSNSELFRFLRERIRDRSADPIAVSTVFVPDELGDYNVVIGLPYESPSDVPVGDVFLQVPSGIFARFVPSGNLRDPIDDVWAQVDEATESGTLFRAYKEDVEVVTHSGEVELFISVVI